MKLLLDTSVWWNWITRRPLHPKLRRRLEDPASLLHLSPLSVAEMHYKLAHKKEPAPADAGWCEASLRGFRRVDLGYEAARLAGEWPWREPGDPVDRMLAAIAKVEGLTLIHTDAKLKKLAGFPHEYFPAASKNPPAQLAAGDEVPRDVGARTQ